MVWYALDEDASVGVDAIDACHQGIAVLSRELVDRCRSGAALAEVKALFLRLEEALVAHFKLEEAILRALAREHDIADHLFRHRDNHNFFRDSLKYARGLFDEPGRTEPPDILPLIPQRYFDELKELDAEMGEIFARHSVPRDATGG